MDWKPVYFTAWSAVWGLACVYIGHRLRLGEKSRDSRRSFRNKISNIARQIASHSNVGLWDAYKQSVDVVVGLCNDLSDDIGRWRRTQLKRCCANYCGLRDEEADPIKRPEFMEMSAEDRTRAYQELRKRLTDALAEIVKCAR